MPFPAIIAGAISIAAAGVGIKKSLDAKKSLAKAKEIGAEAESKYQTCQRDLEAKQVKAKHALETLGRLKVDIFSNQIKHLVETIKKVKDAKSSLSDFEQDVLVQDLPEIEKMVELSLEIEYGLAAGGAAGALAALGAYSAAGTLGLASSGTVMATLSGAAVTNATLALFGGGAVAAGGLGLAGGMVVLGGLALGPALAVGGFVIASKAEKALTKAYEYRADVDQAIATMQKPMLILDGIQSTSKELASALTQMVERFDALKVDDITDKDAFYRMVKVGKNLKNMLNIPVLLPDGSLNQNVQTECRGYLTLGD